VSAATIVIVALMLSRSSPLAQVADPERYNAPPPSPDEVFLQVVGRSHGILMQTGSETVFELMESNLEELCLIG
jgi:hypothetical protein